MLDGAEAMASEGVHTQDGSRLAAVPRDGATPGAEVPRQGESRAERLLHLVAH